MTEPKPKRTYTDAQKQAKRERLQAWRAANPEKTKAQRARSYAKARLDPVARAKNCENVLRWQRENPDKVREKYARRLTREAEAGGARPTGDLAATLWAQYEGKCAYCGAPAEEWDHVVPMCAGGKTTADNCVPACRKCNAEKGTKILDPSAGRGML